MFGRRRKEESYQDVAFVDPGPTPQEWGDVARELAERAGRVAGDPEAILIVEIADSDAYTQWLGMAGGSLHCEASSQTTEEQNRQLAELGWRPPVKRGPDPTVNWNRGWVAPVDAAEVARLTVHTLRLVYGAQPSQIRFNVVQ
ncbi:MAG: TY-Chap domain-containing protein [Stackebrandtia sp.]